MCVRRILEIFARVDKAVELAFDTLAEFARVLELRHRLMIRFDLVLGAVRTPKLIFLHE